MERPDVNSNPLKEKPKMPGGVGQKFINDDDRVSTPETDSFPEYKEDFEREKYSEHENPGVKNKDPDGELTTQ